MTPLTTAELQELDELDGSLRCASCGCTQNVACEGGCGWASYDPPVCTSCVGAIGPA